MVTPTFETCITRPEAMDLVLAAFAETLMQLPESTASCVAGSASRATPRRSTSSGTVEEDGCQRRLRIN